MSDFPSRETPVLSIVRTKERSVRVGGGRYTQARFDRAIASVRACGAIDQHERVQLLAGLGDVDGAYAAAEELLAREGERGWWGMLFEPSTQSMRRDRRFMPFMQRAGLIEYWRASDRWPDFCAEPDLPFDCRTEAT